jgi:hypothetical protein
MMRSLLAIAVVLGLASSGHGQALRAVYFESRTISSTAIAPCTGTCASDVAIVQVFCTIETAGVRWRADGTDPTAAVGHLVNAGGSFALAGHNQTIARLRLIRVTVDATSFCTLLRP